MYDCWFVTKDNKICMRQKASFDSEKNEWDAKETLYELSEDGKVLKNCTEGGQCMTFVEKTESCWIMNSELSGAIVTMHDYLAGVTKDRIEAELKP